MNAGTSREIQSIIERPTGRTADVLVRSENAERIKERLEEDDIGLIRDELSFNVLRVELPESAVETVSSWPEVDSIQVNHEFRFHDEGN